MLAGDGNVFFARLRVTYLGDGFLNGMVVW